MMTFEQGKWPHILMSGINCSTRKAGGWGEGAVGACPGQPNATNMTPDHKAGGQEEGRMQASSDG